MRDFEQRKAEIFRRGEEKIKQNKRKRNRLAAACVPAACVCLCAVYLYSGMNRNKAQEEEKYVQFGTGEQSTVAAGEAVQEQNGRVEVFGEDFSNALSEPERVAGVKTLIGGILESKQFKEDSDMEDDQSSVREAEYTVMLTDGVGNTSEYILSGSTLTDRDTGMAYRISPGVLAELREALGIPAE